MAAKIDKFQLSDGTSIDWLGFGNGTANAKKLAVSSTKSALDNGIRHLDTAQIYGTEEATIQAVEEAGLTRKDVYITSKIATPHGSDEEIRRGIEETLSRLQSVPDLYLIHNPMIGDEDRVVPTWKVMEDLKDEGKLKSIGVSNFRPQDFEKLLKVCRHKPVINQLEFHPLVLKHLEPVLAIHKEHNIVTESYGPLTASLRFPKDRKNPLKETLDRIAKRLSSETSEDLDEHVVSLLWIKAKNAVAVTSSGNPENIAGLARTAKLSVSLTPEEVKEIDDIASQWHFRYYNEHMSTDFPDPDVPAENIIAGRK